MSTQPLRYQSGFGNEFASEALPGILVAGRNNPQAVRYGLYAEQLSGTAFTAPRAENRRSWLYRIQPSVAHGAYARATHPSLRTAPFNCGEANPGALRWSPKPMPESPHDFIDGLFTVGGNGSAGGQEGMAVHIYTANRSMHNRAFANADGELLVVPQLGRLRVRTELGILEIEPQEFLLIPRGLRFSVELLDSGARGYICENYGAMFRLPELGPIGANGLANPRDFLVPVADYEDRCGPCQIVTKYQGRLWQCETSHSPFDVVAWHGDLAPCKFDLRHFVTYGSISVDSPDPSISTVLTAPSCMPGTANVDFVAFAPRWQVAEGTFRPPYFHRNFMSEFMGSIAGIYEGKADGFVPGGASLHNCMTPHGPDAAIFQSAATSDLKPHKLEGTMAFMFETRYPIQPTRLALDADWLQPNYTDCWNGLERRFRAPNEA